jgi:hypothetical protein
MLGVIFQTACIIFAESGSVPPGFDARLLNDSVTQK